MAVGTTALRRCRIRACAAASAVEAVEVVSPVAPDRVRSGRASARRRSSSTRQGAPAFRTVRAPDCHRPGAARPKAQLAKLAGEPSARKERGRLDRPLATARRPRRDAGVVGGRSLRTGGWLPPQDTARPSRTAGQARRPSGATGRSPARPRRAAPVPRRRLPRPWPAYRGSRTVPPQARHGCASDFDCCMPVPAVPDRLEASSAAFSTRSRARSTSRFSTEATAASIHAPNISGTTAISPHTIT